MENAYLRNTNAIDSIYAAVKPDILTGMWPCTNLVHLPTVALTITWVNGYRESGIRSFVHSMDILEQWALTQVGRNIPADEQINFVFAGGAMLCYFGARYICKVAPEFNT